MIDQLSPPVGQVRIDPRPDSQRQRGTSFQQWIADSKPPEEDGRETTGGGATADPVADSAGSMLQEATVRVELQVRDAHGNTELVAMPWRLAASGHLEQESISAHLVVAGARGLVPGDVLGSTIRAAGSQPSALPTPGASIAYAAAPPVVMAFLPVRTSVVTAPAADANTHTSSAAAAPLAVRLMRWMEQHGHDPSLWIRDYRLDEVGAQAIAEAMRQMARDQGLHLERIVVNAREVWRAPESATDKENVACP